MCWRYVLAGRTCRKGLGQTTHGTALPSESRASSMLKDIYIYIHDIMTYESFERTKETACFRWSTHSVIETIPIWNFSSLRGDENPPWTERPIKTGAHLKAMGDAMPQGHPNWQHITSWTLLEIGKPNCSGEILRFVSEVVPVGIKKHRDRGKGCFRCYVGLKWFNRRY